ncbi:MAG TPA: AI-2E family transporter [Longimicrobiales bacterium]|nr:AI-2E family transporter [Longimicrobiales bacterium]
MDATRVDSRRSAPLPVVLASLVIVIAGLKAAAGILVPITLAFFLALVLLPLLRWLQRRRMPTSLAILTVIVIAFVALGAFALVASGSVADVRDALPRYVARVQVLQAAVVGWLAAHRIAVPSTSAAELLDAGRIVSVVGTVVRAAVEILERTLLIFLIIVLVLAESIHFPEKVRRIVASGGTDLGRFERVAEEVFHYLTIKTLVSLATGILMGLLIWALGIDFPLLWGMLAFALNYVPNVGGAISVLPPVALALLANGPGRALLLLAGYFAVHILLGSILEPHFLGRKLGLSTLVVFLSLIFWGWLWGPAGLLLSVPLTMAIKIVLEQSDQLRWIAVLLGTVGDAGPAAIRPRPPAALAAPEPGG